MDATFYEDQLANLQQRPSSIQDVKSNVTLDVSSTAHSVAADPCVIRLSSPEFERFIVQQEQVTTSTPTAVLFPRSVTQEQEEYAQGFIQALEKLHKSNGQPYLVTTSSSGDMTPASGANLQSLLTSLLAVQSPFVVTSIANHFHTGSVTAALPSQDVTASDSNAGVVISSSINFSNVDSGTIVNPTTHRNPNLLPLQQQEMPQTVPCGYSSPPDSPDDGRLEQKRARNRIAAQKCRIRKIERIVDLSERVRELKAQNACLAQTSNELRSQLEDIRRQLLLHFTSGCHVMVSGGGLA